jgi:hypothetical protein
LGADGRASVSKVEKRPKIQKICILKILSKVEVKNMTACACLTRLKDKMIR